MKSGFSLKQIAIAVLALNFSAACAIAQTSTSEGPQPNDPTLKVNPQKALESFEPPADAEYELGAGDEITIEVPGHIELTGKHTIGPDGRITMPQAGDVHIADLTRSAAGKTLETALAKYYTNLSVTVSVEKYSSNRVRVLGYVLRPGEILFEDTPTLLDAISRAGLIQGPVKDGVPSTPNAIPETCTIYRGNDEVVPVNLRSLLMSGNALADLRLRRNDIVFVPNPKENFVSVFGEVLHKGTIPLTPESTLTSVLAEAGCCTDAAGNSPKIHIIQPSSNKDTIVSYKELISLNKTNEIALHSGDIIVIPKTKFAKATYIMQQISPVATLVSLAALVGGG